MHDCPHGKIYSMEACPECETEALDKKMDAAEKRLGQEALADSTRPIDWSKATFKGVRIMPERNILKEADAIINNDRPSKYGRVEDSYLQVADVVNAIHRGHADEGVTTELCLKVLIAVKLVRDSYSPDNPDHLRDAVGYIGLLDQVRQRRKGQEGGPVAPA